MASDLASGVEVLIWVVFGVVLLAGLCFVGWKLFAGLDKLNSAGSDEERRFELEQLQGSLGTPMIARVADSVPQPPAEVPVSAVPDSPVLNASGGPDKIAMQLASLGVVTMLQGRIPLAVPPDGLIYELKKGGNCAILPRAESTETMEHFCRRFDVVFFPSPSGELLIIERFQSRLPSLTNF
ncbi:hypothetical protein IT570_00100 [Candidatus Sumerlaeota bacterium]|nr:hypothetical protein [Candidatus Sumerlaeota bacterium]